MWYLIKLALAVGMGLIPVMVVAHGWVVNQQLSLVPAIAASGSLLILAVLLVSCI